MAQITDYRADQDYERARDGRDYGKEFHEYGHEDQAQAESDYIGRSEPDEFKKNIPPLCLGPECNVLMKNESVQDGDDV